MAQMNCGSFGPGAQAFEAVVARQTLRALKALEALRAGADADAELVDESHGPGAGDIGSAVLPPADPPRPASLSKAKRVYRSPRDVTDEELLAALRNNAWRLQPTAAQLDISRSSLYDLIDRSPGIRKASDVSPQEIADCSARGKGYVEPRKHCWVCRRSAIDMIFCGPNSAPCFGQLTHLNHRNRDTRYSNGLRCRRS